MKKRLLALLLAALCCAALLPVALPVSAAEAEVPTADNLVIRDGLLAEFRYGDSVVLGEKGAAWTSTDGQYTAILSGIYDGGAYDIRWQKDENGAPFTVGGWAYAHRITLPDALGAGKDILMLETTFLAYGSQTDADGKQIRISTGNWDQYNGLALSQFQLCGAQLAHFNWGHSVNNMQDVLFYSWSNLSSNAARYNGTTKEFLPLFGTAEEGVSGKVDTLYLSRQYLRKKGEKDIMQVAASTSLAAGRVQNTDVAAGYEADNSKTAPAGTAVQMVLFQGLHAKVYFIRLYDRILTDAEKAQNRFADIVRYYGLDLTEYAALEDGARKLCHAKMAEGGMEEGAAERLHTAVAEAKAEWDASADVRRELAGRADYLPYYVQDGLVQFYDAFVGLPAYNETLDVTSGLWQSRVGNATATLGGTWTAGTYGISYRLDKNGFQREGSKYGVFLEGDTLPESFTVQVLANPIGLTDETGERFVDSADSPQLWGIYTDNWSVFSFGTMRAMGFVSRSNALYASTVGFHLRWSESTRQWAQHNGSDAVGTDEAFTHTDGVHPVAYTMSRQVLHSQAAVGRFYLNLEESLRYTTVPLKAETPSFELMRSWPCDLYCIRVYDRVLNTDELAQNHAADLLAYYGADTALLDVICEEVEDKTAFWHLFDGLDFTMTAGEGKAAIQNALVGVWLRFDGFSARLDGVAGVRAQFTLLEENIAAFAKAGYRVQAGILLNLSDTRPTLEQHEVRAILQGEDGAQDTAYFLSDATAAMAVYFENPDSVFGSRPLYFRGYVILEKDGERQVLYADTDVSGAGSLFSVYRTVAEKGYGSNAYVQKTVDACYHKETVLVDASRGSDGNDGFAAPVKTLSAAWEKMLELLQWETPVDVTLSFAPGTYLVEQTMELKAGQIGQQHYRLTFRGEDAVLTGARTLNGADFGYDQSTGRYDYALEPDADGNYPNFRVLYVNGGMATLAHEGYTRRYDAQQAGEDMMRLAYAFEPYGNADRGKVYLPCALLESLDEEDFETLEIQLPVAWYFRSLHIAGYDVDDVVKDPDTGEELGYGAYFRTEEGEAYSTTHTERDCVFWLTNCLSFVDEGGEYFYNQKDGILTYYPREGENMEDCVFGYSELDNLLVFTQVENLTLTGLTFTGTDTPAFDGMYFGGQASTAETKYGPTAASAVYLSRSAKNVKVENCTFRALGASGLAHAGTLEGLTVTGCTFADLGSSAVDLGGRQGTVSDESPVDNIRIAENVFDNIAVLTRGSVALIIGACRETEIVSNTFRNTSYSCISVGWKWDSANWNFGSKYHLYHVSIRGNYFTSFMTDEDDGGAVYTLGGNVDNGYHETFNEVAENVVFVDEKTGTGTVMPYYHDGASSNWHTYDNVELLMPGHTVYAPLYLQNINVQEAHNILAEDNIFLAAALTPEEYLAGRSLTPEETEIFLFGLDVRRPDDNGSYYTRVDESRGLEQVNNTLLLHPDELAETAAYSIMGAAGAPQSPCDIDALLELLCTAYDIYYAD